MVSCISTDYAARDDKNKYEPSTDGSRAMQGFHYVYIANVIPVVLLTTIAAIVSEHLIIVHRYVVVLECIVAGIE